jgi:hypothetical protein
MKSRRWSTGRAAVYGFIIVMVVGLVSYLLGYGRGLFNLNELMIGYLLPLPMLFALIALVHNAVFAEHWSAGPDETGVRLP